MAKPTAMKRPVKQAFNDFYDDSMEQGRSHFVFLSVNPSSGETEVWTTISDKAQLAMTLAGAVEFIRVRYFSKEDIQ